MTETVTEQTLIDAVQTHRDGLTLAGQIVTSMQEATTALTAAAGGGTGGDTGGDTGGGILPQIIFGIATSYSAVMDDAFNKVIGLQGQSWRQFPQIYTARSGLSHKATPSTDTAIFLFFVKNTTSIDKIRSVDVKRGYAGSYGTPGWFKLATAISDPEVYSDANIVYSELLSTNTNGSINQTVDITIPAGKTIAVLITSERNKTRSSATVDDTLLLEAGVDISNLYTDGVGIDAQMTAHAMTAAITEPKELWSL